MLSLELLTQWITQVVEPIERAKIEKEELVKSQSKLGRLTSWLSRSKT